MDPGEEHRNEVGNLEMTVAHRTLKILGFSPALTTWCGEQESNGLLHDYKQPRFGIRFTRDL